MACTPAPRAQPREPYINRLLKVASLVAEAIDGKDPNLVITALLHDAIEDCEVPHKLIAESFGIIARSRFASPIMSRPAGSAARRGPISNPVAAAFCPSVGGFADRGRRHLFRSNHREEK